MNNYYLPDDLAVITQRIGDLMLSDELPMWERLEFDAAGLLITVAPEHFTAWRNVLDVATPTRTITQTRTTLTSHGLIEGIGLTLEANSWANERRAS